MNGTAPAITCTDPLADLGGLPFVDDGFRSRRLLAAAAAARHVLAERQGRTRGLSERTLEGWLAPARALT
ncbi:hypothetical protein ABZ914_19460, partial [Spirillospora sp. NPDC046719]